MDRLNLLEFIPFRLNRLAAEFSNALAADYARFGIDIPEWRVLATLGQHDAPRSANYVVRCTRTHKSRISRAVGNLVELGLVERLGERQTERPTERQAERRPARGTGPEGDPREIMLRLTARGRSTYRELLPLLLAREAELLSGLSPAQRAGFEAVLLALEASLDLMRCGADGAPREAGEEGEGLVPPEIG